MDNPLNQTDSPATPAFRRELRRTLIEQRQALPAAERTRSTDAIVGHLDRALRNAPGGVTLAFCWPMRGEPDLRALAAAWHRTGLRLCLPRVVTPKAPMEFVAWQPDQSITIDRHGVPVPHGPRAAPDIALAPLNAFDAHGYRLGYGGGYFDRTLAVLQPRPLTVGVGFDLARVDTIEPDPFDIPMDFIVTESGLYQRNGTDPLTVLPAPQDGVLWAAWLLAQQAGA